MTATEAACRPFETKGFSMMISPMPECDGREETTKQPEAKYQIYGMAGASHRSGGRKPPISRDGGASGQSVLGGDDRRRRALPRHQRIGIVAFIFADRSEEHTSELQSLMRISYAVFCLKKKTNTNTEH